MFRSSKVGNGTNSGPLAIGTLSLALVLIAAVVSASTTISTNISTAGTITVSGTAASTLANASTTSFSSSGGAWFGTGGADNIGVGTTSPNWKFSVAGIGSFDDLVRASRFSATSTSASVFPYASSTSLSTSAATYIATGGGNSGVGTTSPTSTFQVSVSAATSTVSVMSIGTTKGGRLILQDVAGGTCSEITTAAGVVSAKAVACP